MRSYKNELEAIANDLLTQNAIKLLHRQNPNRLYICGDLTYMPVYEDGFMPNLELITISLKLLSRCDSLILVNFDDMNVWQTTLWASAKTAGIPIEYYNGTFVRLLEYKADWNDKQIVKINRFYPSSKTCCECGWINQDLNLSIREWTCKNGHVLDRDLNAAKNILKEG